MNIDVQRIVEGIVLFACCLCIVLFASAANATPFLWVDTVNGDDASADPYQPNTPLRTYARAIALGADGDTIGVKVKPGSAMPTAEEAFVINSRKPDKVVTHNKQEVIAGHGELPSSNVETSSEAGLKVTTIYTWEIFTAPNGQIAERVVNIERIVEEY